MASGTVQRVFNRTCVPINYRCDVNTRYIDPCSCTSYFLCETEKKIILQHCPDGTGFNQADETCPNLGDLVIDGICDQERPWDRCWEEYDSQDLDDYALEERCTGVRPPSPDDGADGGLIAGVIIAVLVVIILVAVLIVYIRKKGNPIQHLRSAFGKDGGGQGSTQPSAPRYGSGPGDEETYAEIDDTALYKDPSGGKKLTHSTSHTNETYDRDAEEGVAYDNPALRRDTPPTPSRNPHPVPEEYSSLDEKEQVARSYSSLNEHKAAAVSGDRNSKEPTTGDDGYLVAEAIGESLRSSSPVDPSYFVLEKS